MNEMRKLKKRKKPVSSIFIVMIFAALLMGIPMFTSMARDEESSFVPYYKSIRIRDGDSLWSIADQYKTGGPMNTDEYVIRLKKMNNLKQDTIHAGQYLTVVYFE